MFYMLLKDNGENDENVNTSTIFSQQLTHLLLLHILKHRRAPNPLLAVHILHLFVHCPYSLDRTMNYFHFTRKKAPKLLFVQCVIFQFGHHRIVHVLILQRLPPSILFFLTIVFHITCSAEHWKKIFQWLENYIIRIFFFRVIIRQSALV